ncbi:threonylcarbamoyl-AMP synthase, partial [Candidatus Desantisbacteria bacterium CG_4_10_14_0_8_um_filter_39_17]
KINSKKPERKKIEDAAAIVRKGGVIIFPTDTVYGIGASAFNSRAVNRIYKIKGRERKKPLILFIKYKKDLHKFVAKIPGKSYKFIKKFWPGPLTLIFKSSKKGTIGIRIPKHPVPLALVGAAGPMATTSANISGYKSARKIGNISKKLLKRVDLVIDGGSASAGKESTILDLTQKPFRVLREGVAKINEKNIICLHWK